MHALFKEKGVGGLLPPKAYILEEVPQDMNGQPLCHQRAYTFKKKIMKNWPTQTD